MGGCAFVQMLVAVIALATVGIRCIAAEAAATTAEKAEEKTTIQLSPELEDKLADFIKRASEAKLKVWTGRMKKEIERIGKVAPLGEEESKALEITGEQASEACLGGWASKLGDNYRGYLGNYDEEQVDQMLAQVDQIVQSDWFGNYLRPFDHPKWNEGIQRILGADKATAWKMFRADRDDALRKEAADVLKATVQVSRQQRETTLIAKGAVIQSLLGLPKERGEKLEALAKTIAEVGAGKFHERAEELLLAMDDADRQQVLKTKQYPVQEEPQYIEAQFTEWQKAATGLLSEEERTRLKLTQETSASRRVVVMGKILITLLDDRIALTESQRQRLEPIAERLVKGQKALFDESNQQSYYRLNPQTFFTIGAKANEEELKTILDPNQWNHWKDVCSPKGRVTTTTVNKLGGGVVFARKVVAVTEAKPTPGPQEPEDVENALAEFFHNAAVTQRKQLQPANLLKAEDAARVAGLGPEALARLETAARGTTEASLAAWRTNTDQTVRSQLRDATAENIKQRLAAIGTYNYQVNRGAGVPESPLWDATVKSEMTQSQITAWKKELESRVAYRGKTVAALIMSEFDRKLFLAGEQWTKLEPIVLEKVKDYAPDIESTFSSSFPYTWFLQSYTLFIPLAAVPEADLKAILSKEQWNSWTGSPEMEMTNNYWENVKSRHEQRTKKEPK